MGTQILTVVSTTGISDEEGLSLVVLGGSLTGELVYAKVTTNTLGAAKPTAVEAKIGLCSPWRAVADLDEEYVMSEARRCLPRMPVPRLAGWVYKRAGRDIQEMGERYTGFADWGPLP